jgi:hypothetical protein
VTKGRNLRRRRRKKRKMRNRKGSIKRNGISR